MFNGTADGLLFGRSLFTSRKTLGSIYHSMIQFKNWLLVDNDLMAQMVCIFFFISLNLYLTLSISISRLPNLAWLIAIQTFSIRMDRFTGIIKISLCLQKFREMIMNFEKSFPVNRFQPSIETGDKSVRQMFIMGIIY